MFTSPRYRINEKSVNPLSENVETSTALIVTSQEEIDRQYHNLGFVPLGNPRIRSHQIPRIGTLFFHGKSLRL